MPVRIEKQFSLVLSLVSMILCLTVNDSRAADITWAAPRTITDESDISTNGTLVHAGSWGTNGVVNVDVGGEIIPFEDKAPGGSVNGGTVQLTGIRSESRQLSTAFDASGTDVGSDFEEVLDGFAFETGGAANEMKVTLLGLTSQTLYEVQVFVSDDRNTVNDILFGDQPNVDRVNPTLGNLTQRVVLADSPVFTGTFFADSTSQDFFLFGSRLTQRLISAYQLRDISPPPLLPGDFNGNGVVDAADYSVWRNNLGGTFDLNGNGDETGASVGTVDEADFQLWRDNFGNAVLETSTVASQQVPEPTSMLLIAIVAGILGVRREVIS